MFKVVSAALIVGILFPSVASAEILVGLLTEQFAKTCSGSEYSISDRHHEIGFTRLTGEVLRHRSNLVGHLVWAEGTRRPWPEAVVREWLDGAANDRPVLTPAHRRAQASHSGCPPYQARSDHVQSAEGIRFKRANPKGVEMIESFEARSISPFRGLSARRMEDRIRIKLTNALPSELSGVKLIAHYEGCFPKPGTKAKAVPIGNMSPGSSGEEDFPRFMMVEDAPVERSLYALHSIQIWSEGGDVLFDFDWPVSGDKALGLACPESRAK